MKRPERILFPALILLAFAVGLLCPAFASGETVQEAAQDRMIGVLITREHLDLFDFESYVNQYGLPFGELDAAAVQRASGRLWAEAVPDGIGGMPEYRFDLPGSLRFFAATAETADGPCIGTDQDDGVSDAHFAVKETDEGREIELECTVYSVPAKHVSFYVNPVYQDASGAVYAVTGQGVAVSSDAPGGVLTQTLSSRVSRTLDGETQTDAATVTVHFETAQAAERYRLLHYGEDGALLEAQELTPDALPEALTPAGAYFICETAADSSVVRSLSTPEDETLKLLVPGEHGLLLERELLLNWR